MKIKLNYARQLWLSLLLLVGVAAIAVPGLNGTNEGTVLEIGTVEQLKEFRDNVNSGTSYAGKTVKLTADLDLSSEANWKPIGNVAAYPGQAFRGVFDGNGKTISNLTSNDETANWSCAGLFGSISNGTIKDLTLTNVDIQSYHYAAGIVAYKGDDTNVSIQNCKVIGGTIKSTPELLSSGKYDNGDKVGGIMGYATAGSTINNCTVEGVTISGYRDLGGIVGYSDGNVTNNTAKNVTVTQDLTNGYKDTPPTTIGDIVGRGSATNNVEANGNKVIKSVFVAQIGTKKYETLEAAWAEVKDGETITLLANCTGNGIKAPQGKFTTGVTIDFNNHTYTMDGSTVGSSGTKTQAFQLLKDNKITFKDGSIIANNADVKMMIQNYSDLTLDNMTLDATQGTNSINYVLSTNNGNTVIKDTKIIAKEGGKAFDADSGWGNYASNTVELTGESVVNGDIEVAFEKKTEGTPSVLKLTSGTLNGNIVLGANADECTVTKSDAFQAAAPADHKWVDNGDGTSMLKPCEYVAHIGDVKYETLEAAWAEVKDGETITLLADCTGNGIKAPQGKFTTGVTIDFNNHTYTMDGSTVGSSGTKTQAFQLLKDNKITFKNGSIIANNADVKMMIQNYSDLTLDNMTLDATQGTNSINYVLSTNNGNTVIKDTKIIAKEGGKAFDVDSGWGNYASNTVELTGESVITGDIEVAFEKKTEGTPSVLKLTSGTLNGKIVLGSNADECTITKSDNFVAAAPADHKWVDNGNGTSTLKPCEYVAQYNNVKFETLQAALDAAEADNPQDIVIDLLGDATLDITAWSGTKNPLAIGTESTKSITINGNSHTLTFNQKNSDWNNVATMNDAETKLILNDMALTSSGYNNGPWNRHDINFNCAVELNNVTSDKALAFKNDATLKNVTVTDTSGSLYGIWIQPNGQNVSIDGLTVTAERGIKIDEEYLANPEKVTLDIANATFNTTKKAGVLVKSKGGADITVGEGINIENVAADMENLVWVDEKSAEEFYKVAVAGATVVPESKESDYVACLMKGEQRWGFYKGTSPLSRAIDKVEDGYSIKLFQTTTEAVVVSKPLVITKNGYTADNVTAGEGYKRFESETEIVIRSFNPICAIGETQYETLADAVAAAGTAETTITLLADAATDGVITGNGVKVQAGQNITFDLKGLTYNVDKTVGSAGTETNGFQLLKGSTVKFTNGTLTSATAKILLQNYSDLTLDGVTVNAGSADYAVSNNFGSLTVTGETNINAKSGGCAFDLWYGMSAVYDDGISVVFDENFTGSVTGMVEYGHDSRVTDENWREKTKLEIKAGKFDIEFVNSSTDALNGANISISGGIFAKKPAEEYCADGYVVVDNEDEATKEQYPYTVMSKEDAGIFEFIDGIVNNTYLTYTTEKDATSITYTRTFKDSQVDKYQSWFIPFDYKITDDDAEKFQFFKVYMVSYSGSSEGGVITEKTKLYIFLEPVTAGTTLKANKPYVVKPSAAFTDYVFKSENVKLLPAPNDNVCLHTETSDTRYNFYGTYVEKFKPLKRYEVLAVNGGQICWIAPTAYIPPYRWYIKPSVNNSSEQYGKITFEFIEEGDATSIEIPTETTDVIEGIYGVNGVKRDYLMPGLNIIKYANGKTKKIFK